MSNAFNAFSNSQGSRIAASSLKLSLIAGISLGAFLASEPAFAQAAPPASTVPETVTVTGSLITTSGFEAPTPVTVVGVQDLENQGIVNLVDISRALPQFRAQGGALSGANQSQNGGQGALNLRDLGANRNLVLLDGQRIVPSTGNGIVDTNILPSALIQRVDVVTGGASAVYGSDAVSGVVNFILNNKFEGFKGDFTGGISQYGDDIEYSGDLAGGMSFLADKLHVVGSVEYYQSEGQDLLNRSFLSDRGGIINNPAYTKTNGQDQNIVVRGNIVASYMTTGGIVDGCRNAAGASITNCALTGTAFGPGGTPHSFAYGTYVNPTGNMVVPIGSTDPDYTQIYDGVKQTDPSQRGALYLHASYDLSDSIELYGSVIEAKSVIGPTGDVPPYRFGTSSTTWLSVTADNAYLPASLAAQMSGPGGGNPSGPYYLNVGRMNYDWGGDSVPKNTNTTSRYVAGFKDNLGGSWTWDTYYEYGRNDYYGSVTNNLITSMNGNTAAGNVNLATDAVYVTAQNVGSSGLAIGSIACRSTLTNPSNGCQPLNIFGYGSASQAAINYIMGTEWTQQIYTQNYIQTSIQGEPFSIGDRPVSVAGGASYRAESIDATVDPNSQAGNFGIGNPKAYSGSNNVKEIFAEVGVPLYIPGLNADIAGRMTQYSTSGQVETWKVGGTYDLPAMFSDFRLRFTRSRDIRAPSLNELFTSYTQSRTSVIDPTKPGNVSVNAQEYQGGNANLKPEDADTVSGGVVYQPSWLSGLSASVDYYNIKIKDAIGTLTPQNIVNFCYEGQTSLCSSITRDANGNIIGIYANNINIAGIETNGFDLVGSYQSSIPALFMDEDATVGVRLWGNYVGKFTNNNGVITTQTASCITCQQPRWTGQALWYYAPDPYQVTIINRFVGGGEYSNLYNPTDPSYVPNAIASNKVDPVLYTDLNLKYDFEKFGLESEAFLNINNVFNRQPPMGFAFGYGLTASPMYDIVGRDFEVGLRFKN